MVTIAISRCCNGCGKTMNDDDLVTVVIAEPLQVDHKGVATITFDVDAVDVLCTTCDEELTHI